MPFTVTVIAIGGSTSSDGSGGATSTLQSTPTVTVKDTQVDTIGYPINVPVVLSAPAANLMYLTITKTGDVNDVLDVIPSRVLIDAGVTLVYFQLILTTPTVPPQITLNFALTSFYTLVHQLSPPSMTLQFFQSTTSANRDPPALRVILTAQPQMSALSEEGLPVLNVNAGDGGGSGDNSTNSSQTIEAAKLLVLPRVINVLQTDVSQNTFSATAFTTDGTFVYYVLALDGAAVATPTSD